MSFYHHKQPLIIAHRGASAVAPENTMWAFHEALAVGADGIECDIRLSKDLVPMVIHDADLRRTGLREEKISELTSAELSQIEVGTWFNLRFRKKAKREFTSEKVPTLTELFELMRQNDKLIYVEMKCEDDNECRIAKSVAEVIQSFNFASRIIVKSFEHPSIVEMKRLLPEIRTAALFRPKPSRLLNPSNRLVKPTLEADADELSIHYSLATKRAIEKAHLADLPTVIWTADHPVWIKRALKLGIHAIITNNPARLLEKRKQLMSESVLKAGI